MEKYAVSEIVITGVGVTTAIGQGADMFTNALMKGDSAFDVMTRKGRQKNTAFIGAEIASLTSPEFVSKRVLRTASLSATTAITTLHEAWQDADLDDIDPERIGLVIGGSNIQQREWVNMYDSYRGREHFVRPTYGVSFMDSDLCGLCTELFGIKGGAFTVGGASSSGQLAIMQAAEAVESGKVDVCIALGALMDLSYWELQGLKSLGAMGSDRFADTPMLACRPFDKHRDGFIYGECCGAVVIEKFGKQVREQAKPYASLLGWAMTTGGNRDPAPSYEGEVKAIQLAMSHAKLNGRDIDYINPHGTGSPVGDETELKAIEDCGLSHAHINTTKSLIGHGLTAAGTVEVVATLLQMRESQLHPTKNLDEPINTTFNWVSDTAKPYQIHNALCLSMGFGGMSTALCLGVIN